MRTRASEVGHPTEYCRVRLPRKGCERETQATRVELPNAWGKILAAFIKQLRPCKLSKILVGMKTRMFKKPTEQYCNNYVHQMVDRK